MEFIALEKLDLRLLEAKLDALISTTTQLMEENKMLREQQANLALERDALIEKNTLARTRIEAMIARLKVMEAGTDIS
jgi:cell division protein ZapB